MRWWNVCNPLESMNIFTKLFKSVEETLRFFMDVDIKTGAPVETSGFTEVFLWGS